MDNKLPVRKPLRMSHYDYNTAGGYFLTFCTHNRKHFLSRIVGAIHESPEIQLTACGHIVDAILQNIPPHLHVTIDRYVIMPNHVHLIAVITEDDTLRAMRESPPTQPHHNFKFDRLYQNERIQGNPSALR
jgi:REP element-mobilizing transposase RayT